jgi:hypothetical protein
MNKVERKELKRKFTELYPKEAKALTSAKSQKEIDALLASFMVEAEKNLASALGKKYEDLTDEDRQPVTVLTQKEYCRVKSAAGGDIRKEIRYLTTTLESLERYTNEEGKYIAATMVAGGIIAYGTIAVKAAGSSLIQGVPAHMAALAGLKAATVGVVMAIIAIVVIGIIAPLIFFMLKPAVTICLLVNEIKEEIRWNGKYNVYGKHRVGTETIPGILDFGDDEPVVHAGWYVAEKKDAELFGVQYGISLKSETLNMAFGMECPLTAFYVDNNCYCNFDMSAEKAAELTTKKNYQYDAETHKSGKKIAIQVNNGAGEVAYYIARVYDLRNKDNDRT